MVMVVSVVIRPVSVIAMVVGGAPMVIGVVRAVIIPAGAKAPVAVGVVPAIVPTVIVVVGPVPAVVVVVVIVPTIGPGREGVGIAPVNIYIPIVVVVIHDLAVKGRIIGDTYCRTMEANQPFGVVAVHGGTLEAVYPVAGLVVIVQKRVGAFNAFIV